MRLDCAHNFGPKGKNSTLASRKEFFPTYTPPEKTDFYSILRLRAQNSARQK
jgi:hypothetical protein